MSERSINIIFSDLGNVVVCFDRRRAAKNLAVFVPRSEDEINGIINGSSGLSLMKSFEVGEIDDATFITEMSIRLACELDPSQFWPAWNDIFWRNDPVTNLLSRVQRESAGIKLIAMSDTDPHRLVQMMTLSGLVFNGAVASFESEIKAWKKESARPFQAALKMVGVAPWRCLFIDDVFENVRSALKLGIRAHHYETPKKLETELQRLQLISQKPE